MKEIVLSRKRIIEDPDLDNLVDELLQFDLSKRLTFEKFINHKF